MTGIGFFCRPLSQFRPRIVAWTLIGLFGFSALAFSHWLTQSPRDNSDEADFVRRFQGGTLVIAGGGRLPPEIRQRFLDFAGGPRRARLVVIPSYDATDKQSEALCQVWRAMGVEAVRVLHTTSRDRAQQAEFVKPIDEATGVWLSGGSQDWLSQHYAGTLVEDKLRELVDRGGVVGGSSAGAAAMSRVMIEQGLEDAVEGTGLDLFRGAVIDQHFFRRSRMNRLMGLMTSHPELVAFGIDEGTALVVQVPRGRLGVIGATYVLAYVPRCDTGEPRLETLKHGDFIDLAGLKSGRMRISSGSDLDAALRDE